MEGELKDPRRSSWVRSRRPPGPASHVPDTSHRAAAFNDFRPRPGATTFTETRSQPSLLASIVSRNHDFIVWIRPRLTYGYSFLTSWCDFPAFV